MENKIKEDKCEYYCVDFKKNKGDLVGRGVNGGINPQKPIYREVYHCANLELIRKYGNRSLRHAVRICGGLLSKCPYSNK